MRCRIEIAHRQGGSVIPTGGWRAALRDRLERSGGRDLEVEPRNHAFDLALEFDVPADLATPRLFDDLADATGAWAAYRLVPPGDPAGTRSPAPARPQAAVDLLTLR